MQGTVRGGGNLLLFADLLLYGFPDQRRVEGGGSWGGLRLLSGLPDTHAHEGTLAQTGVTTEAL